MALYCQHSVTQKVLSPEPYTCIRGVCHSSKLQEINTLQKQSKTHVQIFIFLNPDKISPAKHTIFVFCSRQTQVRMKSVIYSVNDKNI